MKKKIMVFTGTRAEYGILKILIKAIHEDKDLCLNLIVSGTHLSPEFGYTVREIEDDGFKIDKKIEVVLSSDSAVGVSKAVGLGMISYSEALQELKPDFVLLLGDRFEALAMALAANISKIPVVHLHGGELTPSVLDDGFRHAITKLSFLHFTVTEEYKNRVIQMGEESDRVFNFGSISVDAIQSIKLLSKKELEKKLNVQLKEKMMVVTYHPTTLDLKEVSNEIDILLKALSSFKDVSMVFTKANSDEGGRLINTRIEEFTKKNSNAYLFSSLGQLNYFSMLSAADLVVGNSSSGIFEAPYLKTPTINVGNRQSGRQKPSSVVDVVLDEKKIAKAIEKSFVEKKKTDWSKMNYPFGKGNSVAKIIKELKKSNQKEIRKNFRDFKDFS